MQEYNTPEKLNISKLSNPDTKQLLVNSFDQIQQIASWESFRDDMYSRAADVLGFAQKKHQNWFDDNNQDIQNLIYPTESQFSVHHNFYKN